MACCLFGTKPLPEPMLIFSETKYQTFSFNKVHLKMLSAIHPPFHSGLKVLTLTVGQRNSTLDFLDSLASMVAMAAVRSGSSISPSSPSNATSCTPMSWKMKHINSLAPGRFEYNFRQVILKLILVIGGWRTSFEVAPRWMSRDFTHHISTLVQVMAWCSYATSHYLSQGWPSSISPYGIPWPQWVNLCW